MVFVTPSVLVRLEKKDKLEFDKVCDCMNKGIKMGVAVLVCVLLLSVLTIYTVPQLRVSLFVNTYHTLIEEGIKAGNGVPSDEAVMLGYQSVNSWAGTHPMTEFMIMSWGDTYYGCYYSPDDVPLGFQNTDVELISTGDNCWAWNADGDNHGETFKIMDCWYFFKASF